MKSKPQRKRSSRWRDILHEEPSLLSAEQVTTTLDWLDALRQNGASGDLLQWILADETDNRLHCWQELVSRAKDLRSRVRKLQDSFALPLHDTQSTMALVAWSSQTADRSAKMTSALGDCRIAQPIKRFHGSRSRASHCRSAPRH